MLTGFKNSSSAAQHVKQASRTLLELQKSPTLFSSHIHKMNSKYICEPTAKNRTKLPCP